MIILNFISYLNLLAVILFIVIGIFLGYKIYLFKKEIKKEKRIINLPEFKENVNQIQLNKSLYTPIPKEEKKIYRRNRSLNIIVGLFLLFLIGAYLIINLLNKKTNEEKISDSAFNNNSPIVKYVTSSGIKIYNENWQELSENEFNQLKPESKIFIGIEKLALEDIDKARIKINRNIWLPEDITDLYNLQKKVFYKEYIIATDASILRIDAQLHSKVDGWLGE